MAFKRSGNGNDEITATSVAQTWRGYINEMAAVRQQIQQQLRHRRELYLVAVARHRYGRNSSDRSDKTESIATAETQAWLGGSGKLTVATAAVRRQ